MSDRPNVERSGPLRPHWGYLVMVAAFALTGFLLSYQIWIAYQGTDTGMLTSEWFCGDHETTEYGCSGVFASRFGRIWGIPLPLFGAAYFAFILLWVPIFGYRTFNGLFALFLAVGAAVSIFLLIILYMLPGECRWCLLVHGANGAVILTSAIGFIRHGGWFDFRNFSMLLTKAFLVAFIVLALSGWTMVLLFRENNKALARNYEAVRLSQYFQRGLYEAQKERLIEISPDDHVLGDPSAPVKMVMYKDYQCPHCKNAWFLLVDLLDYFNADDQNNVCLVLRHYPLSPRCNPHIKADYHPFACPASQAAEAVYLVAGEEAFWEYNDLLIQYSDRLDRSPYTKLAVQIGISEDDFREAMRDPEVLSRIEKDCNSLEQLGGRVVPTIFINGKAVDGWSIPGFIESLIHEELNKADRETADSE